MINIFYQCAFVGLLHKYNNNSLIHRYGTYKVLIYLFNEETSETYPLCIHKTDILEAYHQNLYVF